MADEPDARIQAAIDRIQGDSSYQTSLPEPPPPPEPMQSSEWLNGLFGWLAGPGQWLVNAVFVLIIAAAALFILYLTVPAVRDAVDGFRNRLRRKTSGADALDDDRWRPDTNAARNLLEEADALAAAGRFADAVHLLLNHSVADIDRRRPDVLRPALTARAIARLDDLPDAAGQAFGAIVTIVERGLWARLPVGEHDWADARSHYQQFAFGDHWRAGRA